MLFSSIKKKTIKLKSMNIIESVDLCNKIIMQNKKKTEKTRCVQSFFCYKCNNLQYSIFRNV